MITAVPFPHFSQRKTKIQAIVMHALGYANERTCLWRLHAAGVSAHYLVCQGTWAQVCARMHGPLSPSERQWLTQHPRTLRWWHSVQPLFITGQHKRASTTQACVLQLVHPDHKAWHAGISAFGTLGVESSLNPSTIGIEMCAPGAGPYHTAPYTHEQIQSLLALLDHLCHAYQVPSGHVLSHAWCAPTRRQDPYASFPWARLADHGFGYQPLECVSVPWKTWSQAQIIAYTQRALYALGFSCPLTGVWCVASQACLNAYRTHVDPKGPCVAVPLNASLKGGSQLPDPHSITPHIMGLLAHTMQDPTYPVCFRPHTHPQPLAWQEISNDRLW